MSIKLQAWLSYYIQKEARNAALKKAWEGKYPLWVVFWLVWFVPIVFWTCVTVIFMHLVGLGHPHTVMMPVSGGGHHIEVVRYTRLERMVAFPFSLVVLAWSGACFRMAYRVRTVCANKMLGFFAVLLIGVVILEYAFSLV